MLYKALGGVALVGLIATSGCHQAPPENQAPIIIRMEIIQQTMEDIARITP